jgi:hypothetical protein
MRDQAMNLLDGQNRYRQNAKEWKLTQDIEKAARVVCSLILKYGDQPTPSALDDAYSLLIQIEIWKAMCMEERIGDAEKNPKKFVWDSFRGALNTSDDRAAILSIMNLKGFGSTPNMNFGGQRPAKVASAVMRFLLPDSWGVIDWRTAALLDRLNESKGNLDEALRLAGEETADTMRGYYAMINEDKACAYNQQYRNLRSKPSLPRAADVEMALFGLSLLVWPL